MALIQELGFAARMLAKNKGWTAVAVLALALGLGANVAIFSVVGLMIWVPLPYPNSERLISIRQTNTQRGLNETAVSLRDVRDWASASSIATIAAYQTRPMAFSGQGEPQHLPAMQVTPEFFTALGVKPALGRSFDVTETPETESRVAIISHELWQGMFHGDQSVLGRDIRLEGRNYIISGVMPEGFQFLFRPGDVWVPLSLPANQRERSWRGLSAIARLRDGVSVEQAASEIRSISERIGKEDPKAGQDWRGSVRPLADRVVGKSARAAAGTMFGAVAFVLLIACANVASLLLARGTQRKRELALRASLGATRGSLIRLQLAESLLLSLLGGTIGVLSALWTIPLTKRVAPPEMTFFQTATLDWNALLYGLGISIATGVVFGVVPAWLLTRDHLASVLRDADRGSTGGRNWTLKSLVVGEMALALVLVAASTLMIRSLTRQAKMDPGFDKANLMAGHVLLSTTRYPQPAQITAFYRSTLETLRRDGSIDSAAMVETIPLGGNDSYMGIRIEGEADSVREQIAGNMIISPGYFETMRIAILAGRSFTERDNDSAVRVAIVNETFARRYWPKESNPIGKRIKIGGEKAPWTTVVGMARDVYHNNLYDPPRAEIYRPHEQAPSRQMMVVARGRNGTNGVAAALRSAVTQVDRDQPIFRLQSVEALISTRQSGELATTKVLGFLAAIALILAAIGTYGVMAYTAAQRVREIGIRLALGATQSDVFRMQLRAGLTLGTLGMVIGLPAAYAVTPVLRAIGSAIDPRDAAAYSGVAVALFVVALCASIVPAWRAMRVDPCTVLRND